MGALVTAERLMSMFNGKVDEKFRQILCDMRYRYESGSSYDILHCPLCVEVGLVGKSRNCYDCPWYQENPKRYACEVWADLCGYHSIAEALADVEGLTIRLEMISRWLSTPA